MSLEDDGNPWILKLFRTWRCPEEGAIVTGQFPFFIHITSPSFINYSQSVHLSPYRQSSLSHFCHMHTRVLGIDGVSTSSHFRSL